MISSSKSEKMLVALKDYKKRNISCNIGELDESGTRIIALAIAVGSVSEGVVVEQILS